METSPSSFSSQGHARRGRPPWPSDDNLTLRSEYATVRVARDRLGNGDRLAITDMRSGKTTYFDPLELEALAWTEHDELTPFLDPQRRWPDEN